MRHFMSNDAPESPTASQSDPQKCMVSWTARRAPVRFQLEQAEEIDRRAGELQLFRLARVDRFALLDEGPNAFLCVPAGELGGVIEITH